MIFFRVIITFFIIILVEWIDHTIYPVYIHNDTSYSNITISKCCWLSYFYWIVINIQVRPFQIFHYTCAFTLLSLCLTTFQHDGKGKADKIYSIGFFYWTQIAFIELFIFSFFKPFEYLDISYIRLSGSIFHHPHSHSTRRIH